MQSSAVATATATDAAVNAGRQPSASAASPSTTTWPTVIMPMASAFPARIPGRPSGVAAIRSSTL